VFDMSFAVTCIDVQLSFMLMLSVRRFLVASIVPLGGGDLLYF